MRHHRVRLVGAAIAALALLLSVTTRAIYPAGSHVSYLNCTDNVITAPLRVAVAYWGWPNPQFDPKKPAVDASARAYAAGDWRVKHALTQYYKQRGGCSDTKEHVIFGSIPVDTWYLAGPSSNNPSQGEEQAAALSVLQGHYGINNVLLLLAYAQGVTPWKAGATAYHFETTDNRGYAVLPYNSDASNIPNIVFHEFNELVTDPIPDITGQPAWKDPSAQEVSDVCQFTAADASSTSRLFQLLPTSVAYNTFGLQPLQSNLAQNFSGSCVYAYAERSDNFVLGTDNNLYQSTNGDSSWKSWGSPAVTLASGPATVSHDPYSIDVFLNTTSGELWQAASPDGGQSHTWNNWGHPSGYVFSGKPTVASAGSNMLDIYAIAIPTGGGARALFHRSWNDYVDSGWLAMSPGFTPLSPPGATSWSAGNITLAVLDDSGFLHVGLSVAGQNFTWTNAGNNGIPLSSAAPDVAAHDQGSYDVFVADINGALQHYWAVGFPFSTSGWDSSVTDPGYTVKAGTGPGVVARGDQRLLVSYTTTLGSVRQREYDFGWKPWGTVLYANGTNQDADVSSW